MSDLEFFCEIFALPQRGLPAVRRQRRLILRAPGP